MIKVIFKNSWDKYILHLGNLLVVTLLMCISYIVLLKLSLLGGEFLRPFFIFGIFHVIFNINDKSNLTDFFIGFQNKDIAIKLLIYGFLKTVFLAIGLIILVLPGIYFEFATIFTLPIILMEKDIPTIDAFKKSMTIFNRNFTLILLIIFILLILNVLTAFPYGLFSIFTIPFSIVVIGETYKILTKGA